MLKPRYVMIGGFLGAGKTTAILRLAELLHRQDQRVGLITNDQSTGLVDTALLSSHGYATEEISGGCFCCKFDSLIEAADKLTADVQPDIFLAEPVGSCTDLRSTVSYPLRRMYGDNYTVAPLSVLADPVRAQRVLGLKTGKQFSAKVVYIYEKQLEEADIVIINKTDLVTVADLDELDAAIRARWPGTHVMQICARTGLGVDRWLEAIVADELTSRSTMEVDYDRYAEGEALLGWLNLSADLSGVEFDGNRFLIDLATDVITRLRSDVVDIAHMKMTLLPSEGPDLAVVNLVRDGADPELSHWLADPLTDGELVLNLRAEGAPEALSEGVIKSLHEVGAAYRIGAIIRNVSAFRPGRPIPVHRFDKL